MFCFKCFLPLLGVWSTDVSVQFRPPTQDLLGSGLASAEFSGVAPQQSDLRATGVISEAVVPAALGVQQNESGHGTALVKVS